MTEGNRTIKLHDLLNEIKSHAEKAVTAGAVPIGACLRPNPQTGMMDCIPDVDATTCQGLGGNFLGGPCGPTSKIPT